jgi:putative peptidoglycan lipid II flippase
MGSTLGHLTQAYPLRLVGLALATSLSSWLNVLLLGMALSARLGRWSDMRSTTLKSIVLSMAIGLGAWLTPANKYVSLVLIAVWAVVYMALAVALKVEEATLLLAFIRKRLVRRAGTP